jgi:hypothetical protein
MMVLPGERNIFAPEDFMIPIQSVEKSEGRGKGKCEPEAILEKWSRPLL